jgi:hypothetical protein
VKHIKLFESFSISGEFRKFVNNLPAVKAAFEDDTRFSYTFGLYKNPIEDLDAEYIIASYYSTGNGDNEEDDDDHGIEVGYNETEYFLYRNGAFQKVSEEEDEIIRDYEDDGNYFVEMEAEDSIDISDRVKEINRLETAMKPEVIADDTEALKNAKSFVNSLKHIHNVKPQNKLNAYKSGNSFTTKRANHLDPEFHYSFTLFTNDQVKLKKQGVTHFIFEYYTDSITSERTFYVMYNSGEKIREANQMEDDLYRGRDNDNQYFDSDELVVDEVFNYFGDIVDQTEEEYQQEAYKTEQLEQLQKELEQAIENEDYEKARSIQQKLDEIK